MKKRLGFLLCASVWSWGGQAFATDPRERAGVTLEALVPGGGYMLWVDKLPLYIFDFAPQTVAHFHEAHGTIDTLEAVFVSELQAPRDADLNALLTVETASARKDDLPVYGPSGVSKRLASFFNAKKFDHLNPATPYRLVAHDIKDTKATLSTVFTSAHGEVDALSVAHGKWPGLAYRIRTTGKSIVIVGDSDGAGNGLIDLAMGANLLVVSSMPAARVGEIAAAAKVKRLLVSPAVAMTEAQQNEARAVVAKKFKGPVSFAAAHAAYFLP